VHVRHDRRDRNDHALAAKSRCRAHPLESLRPTTSLATTAIHGAIGA
jgi:hypothetical protein